MRWLTRLHAHRGSDRGAAAIVVAVVVSGFLLGLGAVVTDFGSWTSERAQLQNGADAGALAVAQTCAAGTCNTAAATGYAPGNNNGALNDSAVVMPNFPCGSGPGLSGCPSGVEDGNACPPAPNGKPYVDVRVQTSTPVAPILGNLLDKNDTGKTVYACAQAQWGGPGSCGTCVPFTISDCEWRNNTGGGTKFATAPTAANPAYPPSYLDTLNTRRTMSIYDIVAGVDITNYYLVNNIQDPHKPAVNSPVAGSETVLIGHGFGDVCKSNSGQDAPGQFGWLGKNGAPCTVTINNGTYTGSTGTVPPSCHTAFQTSRNNQTPIYLPVYSSATGTGSNVTYSLEGFAAFVITGWGGLHQGNDDFKGDGSEPSVITLADSSLGKNAAADAAYDGPFTGPHDSPANTQAIYGYFTQALIPPNQVPGGQGQNLGATTPYLTG